MEIWRLYECMRHSACDKHGMSRLICVLACEQDYLYTWINKGITIPTYVKTGLQSWVIAKSHPRVPLRATQWGDWYTLHRKSVKCIHSSGSHDCCYRWSLQGQNKLLITQPSRVRFMFIYDEWMKCDLTMFEAEYFPRFWGTSRNFLCKMRRSTCVTGLS